MSTNDKPDLVEALTDEPTSLADQAKHHGRDWAVWWQGSGERGDHIMEMAQHGLTYARELAFLGADHHDEAGRLVAEHNEQVRRLREVIGRQAAAKTLLQSELSRIRAAIPASLLYDTNGDMVEAVSSTFREFVKSAVEATALRKEVAALSASQPQAPAAGQAAAAEIPGWFDPWEALRRIAEQRHSEGGEPFDDALNIADSALLHASAAGRPKGARPVGDEALAQRAYETFYAGHEPRPWSEIEKEYRTAWRSVAAALASHPTTGPAPTLTQSDDGVRAAYAPDELTESEIAGRARALILRKGWKFGDQVHGMAVLGMMTEFGIALLKDPPQDRCNHPDCGCDADSVCSAATPSPAGKPDTGVTGERVRHLKRGTEYEVLGEAEAQVARSGGMVDTSRTIADGYRLTVYRCVTTDKLWCRFTDEFRDGRFETITPAPKAETPTPAEGAR